MSSVLKPPGVAARPRTSSTPPLATAAERAAYLSSLALFAGLPARTVERIAREARSVRLPRRAMLFEHGSTASGFWTVVAGRVQLLLPPGGGGGGGEKPLSGHGPGSSFGEAEMFGGTRYAFDCRAIEDTLLLFVPGVAVVPALARCGELARRFLRGMGARMHSLVLDLAQCTRTSAESRIASLLLRLADDHAASEGSAGGPGAETDAGIGIGVGAGGTGARGFSGTGAAAPVVLDPPTVRLPDRKRAIASRLSVAPETFSRALRAFQDEGLIRVEGYRVRILDPQRLMAAARG